MSLFHQNERTPFGSIPREAERLIVAGRVALAVVALVAVWVDPATPSVHPWLLRTLLASYIAGSLTLVALLSRPAIAAVSVIGIGGHLLDILIFGAVVWLDGGLSSPLFGLFTFTVASGAYRWRVRGAMLTTAATTGVLFLREAVSALNGGQLFDGQLSLGFMRVASQFMVALVLGHLGASSAERRRRMGVVFDVRRSSLRDLRALLEESMRMAVSALDATLVVLVWEDPDEPWLLVAEQRADETMRLTHEPPTLYDPVTNSDLYHYDFIADDAATGGTTLWTASQPPSITTTKPPIHPDFVRRFALHRVMGLRVRGDVVDARLFVQTARPLLIDDIGIGRQVSQQIERTLELHLLDRRLREVSLVEERSRVARELHDGLLQSLTGAALMLQTASRKITSDPAGARTLMAAVQKLMLDEQRDLRGYLQELMPVVRGTFEHEESLSDRLFALAERFDTVFGVRVFVSIAPEAQEVSPVENHEVFRLTQEAITNAAKHGKATEVTVVIARTDRALHLTVTDNGTGFQFRGPYDLTTLEEIKAGPQKLKERVKALRGDLSITSSSEGAVLQMTIPTTVEESPHADSPRTR